MFSEGELRQLALSDAAESTESDRKPENKNFIWVPATHRTMQKLPICRGGIQSMSQSERQFWIEQGFIQEQ